MSSLRMSSPLNQLKVRKVKADIAALNSLRQVSAPNEDVKHKHEHEIYFLWEQMIADATEVHASL